MLVIKEWRSWEHFAAHRGHLVGVVGSRGYPRPDAVLARVAALPLWNPILVGDGGIVARAALAGARSVGLRARRLSVSHAATDGTPSWNLRNRRLIAEAEVLLVFADKPRDELLHLLRLADGAGVGALLYGHDGEPWNRGPGDVRPAWSTSSEPAPATRPSAAEGDLEAKAAHCLESGDVAGARAAVGHLLELGPTVARWHELGAAVAQAAGDLPGELNALRAALDALLADGGGLNPERFGRIRAGIRRITALKYAGGDP